MKFKKIFFLLFLIILISSCKPTETGIVFRSETARFFIWDPERVLSEYAELAEGLHDFFPDMMILSGNLPEDAAAVLEREFKDIDEDSLCILMVISGRTAFHLSSEWNLWFPQLWRSLDCRGRILIADAPWGDEFADLVKTKRENSVWVIDGIFGHLRKKLGGSLTAASCRFDEANLVSRGIDGKTKTPLYSWYFLDLLLGNLRERNSADIAELLDTAERLTISAHERGVVTDVEEVLFFNRSQVDRQEFRNYPNPVVWNGLGDRIIITNGE